MRRQWPSSGANTQVIETLAAFPEEAGESSIPSWPQYWQRTRNAGPRTLAYSAGTWIEDEHGERYDVGDNPIQLRETVCRNNLALYIRDEDFDRWIPSFTSTGECLWNPAHERVSGFRFKLSRKVHYVYRASVWGIDSVRLLARLRRYLDDMAVGDCPTPGAVGFRLMSRLFPGSKRLRRPSWPAWKDMHDNLQGGRTELLTPPGNFDQLTELDLNGAYAHALAEGAPAGSCMRLFCEEDVSECAWTYCLYRWELPRHVRVDVERLGTRMPGGRLRWRHEVGVEYEGWYTGAEVRAARDAGYRCTFVRGWGFDHISDDFTEWARWMDSARGHYKSLRVDPEEELIEERWCKLATVAAIGRFGMDRVNYIVTTQDYENLRMGASPQGYLESKTYGLGEDAISVQHIMPTRERNYLLPQLAIHVHSTVRLWLDAVIPNLGRDLVMRNIDALYVRRSVQGAWEVISAEPVGRWKIRELRPRGDGHIEVPAAGWVLAGDVIKTPGQKR